jgi:hypothetical protein
MQADTLPPLRADMADAELAQCVAAARPGAFELLMRRRS